MNTELKGLVIRTADIKESDRLVTIFTEEVGVVTALARGARSLKSRKMCSTMQYCYSRFILQKRGEYYYVKESDGTFTKKVLEEGEVKYSKYSIVQLEVLKKYA